MRVGDNVVGPIVLMDEVVVVKDKEFVHVDEVASVSGELAEFSEIDCSQSMDDVYSVEELNEFLDFTKGKKVDVAKFFPDVNKFIKSVAIAQRTVGYEVISKQK